MAAAPKTPRQPISVEVRKRLQRMFEHGNKSSIKGDFDYATDMLLQCVHQDPGNLLYVQSFLSNLQRKYDNNKKGSKLAGLRGAKTKTAIKKNQLQKHWSEVLSAGYEMLKLNP